MSKEKLSAEEIREELKRAYQWGVANGENRSEKNFNDYLQTSHAKDFFEAAEQLQREREWISVDERLPEKGVKVLTCLGPYGLSVDIDFISEYSDENKFHYEPTATHWMPLPEPPKPEKQ